MNSINNKTQVSNNSSFVLRGGIIVLESKQ